MDFLADCVERLSIDGVDSVFLGNTENELALVMSNLPGTADHYFEWNDQSQALTNAVQSIELAGRILRIVLVAEAANQLGEADFAVTLPCDDEELDAVRRQLSAIFRSRLTSTGVAAGEKKAAPPKDYSRIKYLNLEGKNLRALPDYVQEMTALETAKLGGNPKMDLAAAFEVLGRLPALRELVIHTDRPVPENIGKLTQLESLEVTGFSTPQVLPEGLGQLRRLKSLLIMSGSDVVLPESLADLTALTDLNVRAESWKLPTHFYRLSGLTELDLSCCRLAQAPEEMAGMDGIQTVALGASADCDYEQILTVVARMPNVRRLELSMSPVPKAVGRCQQLEELVIWTGTRAEYPLRLPDEMFELTRLRNLILNLNYFDEVPAGIGKLTGLERLVFAESEFAELPASIGELVNLTFLCVSENPSFQKLPESVGNLRNLKDLYLSDNPLLTDLPDSVMHLTALVNVRLSGSENLRNVPEHWHALLV